MTITATPSNLRETMSEQPAEPRFINSDDAARILGISVITVRKLAAAGELPAVRLGGVWRFRVADLDNLTRRAV